MINKQLGLFGVFTMGYFKIISMVQVVSSKSMVIVLYNRPTVTGYTVETK